jgi:RHS repeat-associated protein
MKRAETSMMLRVGRNTSKRRGANDTSRLESGIISRGKGQQFDYAFDTIGNRTQTQAGGDQNGANLRLASYTNNVLHPVRYNLRSVLPVLGRKDMLHAAWAGRMKLSHGVNQITSRGVPGAVDVMGDALATNSVTVNGLTAYRKVEYFRQQLPVTNTSAPVWQGVTNASPGQTTVTGHLYVPKNLETYTYDADGNLLSDGRWSYAWDGENRLVGLTNLTGAPSGSQLQLAFAYDYQGRRIQKIVVGGYTNKYAYDDWNLIAEVGTSGSLVRSYLWGSDLSGSLQGAGGVGGLLQVSYYGAGTTNCFVAFDGNGNVSALVNAANGTTVANYDYGPFGELLRATGPMAKLNPFRFSTKYDDDETDLLYYGCRYYNPSSGRWPSKDPIGELGGLNLFAFIGNAPVHELEFLGLDTWTWGTPGQFDHTFFPADFHGHRVTEEKFTLPNEGLEGDWYMHQPGEGQPCCVRPAQHHWKRTDSMFWRESTIKMSVDLSFTGGPAIEVILLWETCLLADFTSGFRPQCVNTTTCTIPINWESRYAGNYLTQAWLSYLSCEGGYWTEKFGKASRDYVGDWKTLGWTYKDTVY